jgi:predicted nucleic acid-binding protein
MAYLLNTGILLRLVDDKDALHSLVQQAVETLISRQEELFSATQNIGEFWNVATRPIANNGLGLAPDDVINLIENSIEPVCGIMLDGGSTYTEIKRLVVAYGVIGKQVHDARLVALMLTRQIGTLLTLNPRDFRRYEPEGIVVVTPNDLVTAT